MLRAPGSVLYLDAIAEHVGLKDTIHLISQFKKGHDETPAGRRNHVFCT